MKRLFFVVLMMGFFLMGTRAFAVTGPTICPCFGTNDFKTATNFDESSGNFCLSKADNSGACMEVASPFFNREVFCEQFNADSQSGFVLTHSEVEACVELINKNCPQLQQVCDENTGVCTNVCGPVQTG